MTRLALLALLSTALSLGGCASSRFGGAEPPRVAARSAQTFNTPPAEPPAEAVPAGSVVAAPLPPLEAPGASGPVDPGLPPSDPGPSGPGPVLADGPPPGGPVEVFREERTRVAGVSGPGRLGVVGGWTARDAAGATCRVQLSSSAALDLYKASASGCANRDLSGVTAWDFRDGEIFLYQPGGAVAARLREGGPGLQGVLAKSGAPLSLTR